MSYKWLALVSLAISSLLISCVTAYFGLHLREEQRFNACLDRVLTSEATSHADMRSGPWLTSACKALSVKEQAEVWVIATFMDLNNSAGA